MDRPEYLKMKLANFPDDVIAHYKLKEKVTKDGFIFCKICKGMYGLPHAGLIAQQLLEKGWKSMATARVTNPQVFGSMIPGLSALP